MSEILSSASLACLCWARGTDFMEDLENGFGSAQVARTEQEVSFMDWQHVSCQSFSQINLWLRNIPQAIEGRSWDKHTDVSSTDPFVSVDKEHFLRNHRPKRLRLFSLHNNYSFTASSCWKSHSISHPLDDFNSNVSTPYSIKSPLIVTLLWISTF